jgi:hypothetical protein
MPKRKTDAARQYAERAQVIEMLKPWGRVHAGVRPSMAVWDTAGHRPSRVCAGAPTGRTLAESLGRANRHG